MDFRLPFFDAGQNMFPVEIQSFFRYNDDASKAIKSATTVMDSLTIQSKVVGQYALLNDFM